MAHTRTGEPDMGGKDEIRHWHGPHAHGRTSINYLVDIRWIESVGLVLLNLEVGA